MRIAKQRRSRLRNAAELLAAASADTVSKRLFYRDAGLFELDIAAIFAGIGSMSALPGSAEAGKLHHSSDRQLLSDRNSRRHMRSARFTT